MTTSGENRSRDSRKAGLLPSARAPNKEAAEDSPDVIMTPARCRQPCAPRRLRSRVRGRWRRSVTAATDDGQARNASMIDQRTTIEKCRTADDDRRTADPDGPTILTPRSGRSPSPTPRRSSKTGARQKNAYRQARRLDLELGADRHGTRRRITIGHRGAARRFFVLPSSAPLVYPTRLRLAATRRVSTSEPRRRDRLGRRGSADGSAARTFLTFKRPAWRPRRGKDGYRPEARVQDWPYERAETARKRSSETRRVRHADELIVHRVSETTAGGKNWGRSLRAALSYAVLARTRSWISYACSSPLTGR